VLATVAAAVVSGGCDRDPAGDDDSAPDSDDDDTVDYPFSWLRYDFEATISGADADVGLAVAVLDEQQELLCTYPIAFEAGYAIGPHLGGPHWPTTDAALALTSATDPGTTDCGPEYGLPYHDSPADLIELWSPLAFYGCGLAAEDSAFLGDDPTTVGDGTFASYCVHTGPAVAAALPDLELGAVEAIWLARGAEGQLDGLGHYTYLPGADGETWWYVFGLLFAAGDNGHEPADGLDGHYLAVPLWMFFKY
jgi:hypothetical protein